MTVRPQETANTAKFSVDDPAGAPLSRRLRRAKGKQPKIPAQAFSAPVVNQRQYAARRRG